MSKKIKGLLALGDITPRTKSNLLETFVSKILKFFFEISVKKNFYTCPHVWLLPHSMSCKHALLRHNVFTLLPQTLSKKSFKKQIIPKFPQKQTKNPPLETAKSENMLKMTHLRSKKQKCQDKIKALLALGDITPRTKSNLLETFVPNRY